MKFAVGWASCPRSLEACPTVSTTIPGELGFFDVLRVLQTNNPGVITGIIDEKDNQRYDSEQTVILNSPRVSLYKHTYP